MLETLCLETPTTPKDAAGWWWARTPSESGKAGLALWSLVHHGNTTLSLLPKDHGFAKMLRTYQAKRVLDPARGQGYAAYLFGDRTALLVAHHDHHPHHVSAFPIVVAPEADVASALCHAAQLHPPHQPTIACHAHALDDGSLATPWAPLGLHRDLAPGTPLTGALKGLLTTILTGCVAPGLSGFDGVQTRSPRHRLIATLTSAQPTSCGPLVAPFLAIGILPYAYKPFETPTMLTWGHRVGQHLIETLPSGLRPSHLIGQQGPSTHDGPTKPLALVSAVLWCSKLPTTLHQQVHHIAQAQALGIPPFTTSHR